jgi:cytochrome P450/NADPH-cytochrome P450 reductase
MTTVTPIPSPPGLPIVGNATQIDPVAQRRSFQEFADKYGEVYRLHFPGSRTIVMVNSHRLIDELCDEKRFTKVPTGVLAVRDAFQSIVYGSLFTCLRNV